MEHQNHSFLSIFFGSTLSITGYLAEHPNITHSMDELIKVIIFGIIGGAFGYFGKWMAAAIHKKFK
jgi:H+/Cl- antiporter ClcA